MAGCTLQRTAAGIGIPRVLLRRGVARDGRPDGAGQPFASGHGCGVGEGRTTAQKTGGREDAEHGGGGETADRAESRGGQTGRQKRGNMTSAKTDQREIVAEYKKQGHFDARRKEFFDTFVADEARQQQLAELISKLVRCKIEKEPELFGKNRGKVSALIQTELVKRHVVRDKLKAKASGGTGTGSAGSTETDGERDSETELLDRINDLLDSFATSVGESEHVQSSLLGELNGL